MDEKFLRLQKKYDKLDIENPHLKIEIRCYINIIWLITQSPDNITENLPSKSIFVRKVRKKNLCNRKQLFKEKNNKFNNLFQVANLFIKTVKLTYLSSLVVFP